MSPDELLNAVRRSTLHLSLARAELAGVHRTIVGELGEPLSPRGDELEDILASLEELELAVQGLLEEVEDE